MTLYSSQAPELAAGTYDLFFRDTTYGDSGMLSITYDFALDVIQPSSGELRLLKYEKCNLNVSKRFLHFSSIGIDNKISAIFSWLRWCQDQHNGFWFLNWGRRYRVWRSLRRLLCVFWDHLMHCAI